MTGGASGLGRATCERLVERGAKVVVADITQSEGEKLVERLGKQSAVFTHCDVTNTQHVEKALQIARERFGQLDVAVSNAGVVDKGRTYASKRDTPHSMASFNRIMNVNVVGAFNVARLAAQMIAKNQPDENGQRGVIIMTASIAAYVAEPGLTAYAGSKGAVASMTLPMARDLADQGIRVVSIAPGEASVFFLMNRYRFFSKLLPVQSVTSVLCKSLIFFFSLTC